MFDIGQVTGVILAGGLGTRLRKAIPDRPKVMAEVNGRPFITYLLDQFDKAGINQIVLCTGYLASFIEKEIGYSYKSIKIVYSEEKTPFGTAGALINALPHLNTKLFLVMNGDSIIDCSLNKFILWHINKQSLVTLVLTHVNNVSRYGKIIVDDKDEVQSFTEKGFGSGPGWINAGMYLFANTALDFLPKKMPASLEEEFFPSLIGKGLYGYRHDGEFIDIGTPERYYKSVESIPLNKLNNAV